jgi:hypothetical protein
MVVFMCFGVVTSVFKHHEVHNFMAHNFCTFIVCCCVIALQTLPDLMCTAVLMKVLVVRDVGLCRLVYKCSISEELASSFFGGGRGWDSPDHLLKCAKKCQ